MLGFCISKTDLEVFWEGAIWHRTALCPAGTLPDPVGVTSTERVPASGWEQGTAISPCRSGTASC